MPHLLRRRLFAAAALAACAAALLILFAPAAQADSPLPADLAAWTRDALSADPAVADPAIEHLRALGSAGLEALYVKHAPLDPEAQFYRPEAPEWPRLTRALDRVSGQYDDYSSRLYWYSDLSAAKAAAVKEHKPIVVLYMLGKLTDEFSCANSRFFRAVLYTDPVVQTILRENCILCWQSERPVPVVTIDMGDGRVLKRTITGNSIHYVLDEQGRVIDGIPGLYNPKAFAMMLTQALNVCQQTASQADTDCQTTVTAYHDACIRRIAAQLQRDMQATGAVVPAVVAPAPTAAPAGAVDARLALPRAESKMAVESPVVNLTTVNTLLVAPAVSPRESNLAPLRQESSFTPTYVAADGAVQLTISKRMTEQQMVDLVMPATREKAQAALEAGSTDWARLALAHHAESALSAETLAYMQRLEPCSTTLCQVVDPTGTGGLLATDTDRHLAVTVDKFRTTLAEDTVRNEFDFHARIHGWLESAAEGQVAVDLKEFNEKVYAELFLTPKSDPWLGLIPPDTFSALPHDGLVR